ncbi:chloride channel protein [Salinisphaera sp. PC39]|uniref:chloride channel protein n=1 Tax=Salinisphaera sp. PC39 TaxID=1304156 RepID=UPI003341C7ED
MSADRKPSLGRRWRDWLDRLRQEIADIENTPGLGVLCALGAATGVLCGLIILGLQTAITGLQGPLFAGTNAAPGHFPDTAPAFRVAVPVLGALFLGLLIERVLKVRDYGVVHIIERLVYYQGFLPVRTAIAEFLVTTGAIVTGQSVGREGTAAQVGATTGSWLGRRLDLPNNSVRTLVGCGAAAGIAASFNTPLAAVILAMEVVMMEYTVSGFAPIILAAVSGSLVTFTLTDIHPGLVVEHASFSSMWELPYLVFVGAVMGLLGAGFTRLTGALTTWLEPIRPSLRMAAAGLVTAVLGLMFPQILGLGFELVNAALAGQFVLGIALGIGAAKFLATAFAAAAAIPGGVILPAFVIGATVGSALGTLGGLAAPAQASEPGFYALIGIGAMMGAVLQAPLTSLVVILELSDHTEVVLPGMLAVITAIVVSRRLASAESVFRMLLRRRGLDYRNDPVSQYLRRASVLSAMNRRFARLPRQVSRTALEETLARNPDWLLVGGEENRASLMRPADVVRFLGSEDVPDEGDIDLIRIPGQRLDAVSVPLRASLQEAYDRLDQHEADALYVQRRGRTGADAIYGVLTRAAIEGAYHP